MIWIKYVIKLDAILIQPSQIMQRIQCQLFYVQYLYLMLELKF